MIIYYPTNSLIFWKTRNVETILWKMTNNGNCVSKNIAKDSDMWISMLNILFLTKKPVILKDVIQRTDTIQVCHGADKFRKMFYH